MAIEIKRTPVLEGDAAKAFIKSLNQPQTAVNGERVRSAIEQAIKILASSQRLR